MRLDPNADERSVAEHLFDVLDVRLDGLPPETRALVRSMLTAPTATRSTRDFLDERVSNLARAMDWSRRLRSPRRARARLGSRYVRHRRRARGHGHGRVSAGPDGRCPLCGRPARQTERYPRAVCDGCVRRATDLRGRVVALWNERLSGGLLATHCDNGTRCEQVTRDGRVLIGRAQMHAEEARLGGTVIQPFPEDPRVA